MGRRGIAQLAVAALVAGAFSAPAPAAAATADATRATLVASLELGAGATDIAFWGDTAVVGLLGTSDSRRDGFAVVDISDPRKPRLVHRFDCTGAHRDISIWRDLVFISSWAQGSKSADCASAPAPAGERGAFAGIRIISISDPREPRLVGAVDTGCGGSHTHTLIPDLGRGAPRVVVWSSPEFYGVPRTDGGCQRIINVPLENPAAAEVVHTVPVSSAHGCHDVTVLESSRLAAAACVLDVRLFDIRDPRQPRELSRFSNPFMVNHHGTSFSWDGNTLAVGDENNHHVNAPVPSCLSGTGLPGALPGSPTAGMGGSPTGAIWLYDVSDPEQPRPRGHFQVPRPPRVGQDQGCTAHNFNVVPTKDGRDVLSAAWYTAGWTLVDFTDPGRPRELAHYDLAPEDPGKRANYYSAYFYDGLVFATNHGPAPGYGFPTTLRTTLDVIDIPEGVRLDTVGVGHLNAQTQEALPPPVGKGGSPSSAD